MQEWNDIELFSAVREGDKEALSVLFLRYYDYLKHYGMQIEPNSVLVEESTQELFIYIFDSYSRLGEVRQVKAYLFKSLRRRILEKIKKEAKHKKVGRDLSHHTDFQFSSEDIHIHETHQDHIHEALADALNQLPWRQREAIYLRYYNSLVTKEIAEIMGVSNQTILNTLYQALKKIRKRKQLKKLFKHYSSFLLIISQL